MTYRTMLPVLLVAAPFLWGADQEQMIRGGPLRLSLKRAVELATAPEGNPNIQLAQEALRQAQSRSAQARAALLPDFEGSIGEQNVVRSLAALGLDSVKLPFDIRIPNVAGPYSVTDIRASVTQTAFDFSSIRRYQAAKTVVRATASERDHTGDAVSALVAKAYLAALRADADLEAVKANVALAQAVLAQTGNRKTAGTGTGIEVTRARVQLSDEQQRLLVAQNQQRKSHLELLRAVGLRLDTDVELTDKLVYEPEDTVTLEQAMAQALKARADFKAQQEREDSARLSASAAKMERLPSVAAFADYGTIGQSSVALQPTREYGLALKVPFFDGGRRDARRAEAASQYRQERVRTNNMRDQIELDLRVALDSLHSADEQVRVAREGLTLADSELRQARRRYEAGVANGLEVTDAQTRLERARDNQTAALFNYNLARIDLAQAMGDIQRILR